jgi:hypothetical protein
MPSFDFFLHQITCIPNFPARKPSLTLLYHLKITEKHLLIVKINPPAGSNTESLNPFQFACSGSGKNFQPATLIAFYPRKEWNKCFPVKI